MGKVKSLSIYAVLRANPTVEWFVGKMSVSADQSHDAREFTGITSRPCLRANSSTERSIGTTLVSAEKL